MRPNDKKSMFLSLTAVATTQRNELLCQTSAVGFSQCNWRRRECWFSSAFSSYRPPHSPSLKYFNNVCLSHWVRLPSVQFLPGRRVFWLLCPAFRCNPGLDTSCPVL